MTLHLLKLCVGINGVGHLKARQRVRLKARAEAGEPPYLTHVTRHMPRRAAELLDGGSLYWVIRGQIRRVDMPARFGGDEFVVLLPEVELELAAKIAERICDKIRPTEKHEDMFSVSGGVAQLSDEHASAEDFLRAVDQALYRAKRAGGRQIMMQVSDNAPVEVPGRG